jgi:Tfp pilus assembly protein PilF
MVLGGCQGIKQSMPDFEMPKLLARNKAQRALADKPVAPAPQVSERNYAQVQMVMGDSLAKEGNYEAAQAAYEAALRNDDKLARAYHRLALMKEKSGKGGDANELFLRAMQLDPKNAEIVCDYGYYCYLRHDLRGAQQHFNHALQLDPNLKRAHNNLGLVYARTGRPDHALQQFARAGLNPADARANLGFVYLTEKRFPQAKSELQLAASANPGSEKARNILARFEKIETSAQPQQVQNVPAPTQVPTIAASTPAVPPSMQRHFDVPVASAPEAARVFIAPPSEGPAHFASKTPHVKPVPESSGAIAAAPTAPHPETRVARAETPRVASAEADAPRRPAEAPPVASVEAPRYVLPASNPSQELPNQHRDVPQDLPTQQSAPVLSDYQF